MVLPAESASIVAPRSQNVRLHCSDQNFLAAFQTGRWRLSNQRHHVWPLDSRARPVFGDFLLFFLIKLKVIDFMWHEKMWHEIPKAYQKVGQFPGAPMHCHRGFCEMPYCKEISGGNSDQFGYFLAKDHTGASNKVGSGTKKNGNGNKIW